MIFTFTVFDFSALVLYFLGKTVNVRNGLGALVRWQMHCANVTVQARA